MKTTHFLIDMARSQLKKRQYTIYTHHDEDLTEWKKLCPPTLTLNGWILTMIEKGIDVVENRQAPRIINPDEINALRMENINLKKELQMAMAKLEQLKIREANYTKLIHEVDDNEREIIDFIKRGKYVTTTELLKATTHLGTFDTEEETEAFFSNQRKKIKHALETLEYAELVELTPRGWKWKGTKIL